MQEGSLFPTPSPAFIVCRLFDDGHSDWASLVAQMVKHLPAMRETWVQSLGQEDPLEKEMANHSSILAWEIPWKEGPGGYSPWGCKELDTSEQLNNNQNVGRRPKQTFLQRRQADG